MTAPEVSWRSDTREAGVRERMITVHHAHGEAPAVIWTPDGAAGPLPLALIGHGGAGHKTDRSRRDLAARYAALGLAAAAIDGPRHGERAAAGEGGQRTRTSSTTVDDMVADWRATIDVISAQPEIDADRIGYGGVSMGTMFGLPLVRAEPRIRCAVLGLCGLRAFSGESSDVYERLARDAPELRVPTLFLMQWDDDLFPRESVLELFDRIGSADKRLLANPGKHHETPLHARAASTAFIADQLRAL